MLSLLGASTRFRSSNSHVTTAILYKLKLNQDVTTIPTVGFNVETVNLQERQIQRLGRRWTRQDQTAMATLLSGTQGLIFVIDSNDRARIDEARQELHRIILDREMKEALLLVFANKQDIPGSMTPSEVTERLRLGQLKDRVWYVVPSCATTGRGLFEGLVRIYQISSLRAADGRCVSLMMVKLTSLTQGWLSNNVKTPPKPKG